jgi:putative transposase
MTSDSTTFEGSQPTGEPRSQVFGDWFDPIETALREQVRGFIEELIRNELDAVLASSLIH